MASRTKAALVSLYNTVFANNTTRDISEQDLRDFNTDITDSYFNLNDHAYTGAKGWNHGINTIAGLKAIGTTSLTLKSYVQFRDTGSSNVLRNYELVSGTDAESSPDVIRPTDYATTTNEKVWKLSQMPSGVTAFTALTDGPGAYTGKTLNFVRVNAGEAALEYRTPAQVKTDLGVLTSLPQNWSFPAGAFPTTAGIIYIATADSGVIGDANYVAIGTWMIANTLTPSTYSHFIYK